MLLFYKKSNWKHIPINIMTETNERNILLEIPAKEMPKIIRNKM